MPRASVSIDATLTQAAATAAQSSKLPTRTYPGTHAESATFRDPAGNVIGLYQEGSQ